MHSFWPSSASKSGLSTTTNAQQLTAEQLHYQQLFRQHQLATYQQQQASLNPYSIPSYDQLYTKGYLHALSHQAIAASMAAASNLMNSANNNSAQNNNSTTNLASANSNNSTLTNNLQPNVNSLLNSSTANLSNNVNHQNTSSNSTTNLQSTNLNSATNDLTTSLTNQQHLNPLSLAAAYNAQLNSQLNDVAVAVASSVDPSSFRSTSASSASAFHINSKKRALSSASPYPEVGSLLDINSMIRCSPSSLIGSLVSAASRSPSATGSIGHLSGAISSPSMNSFPNALSHFISSPNLFSQATSPLNFPNTNPNSGANTPNNLNALTSLSSLSGYNLLANNHHSAFTPPHSAGLSQSNLQFHYTNFFLPKIDSSLSNQGQTSLNKLANNSTTSPTDLQTANNLFKNSTIDLSPVSNSNSPKTNLTNGTNGNISNSANDNSNSNNLNNVKSSSTNSTSSSDEVVSSTSLIDKKKNKRDESPIESTSSNSGSSSSNGGLNGNLSSSRSSQHSESSDIVINSNSTAKEETNETSHQETCCHWEGCGPLEFNDHLELVKHVANEHINKDKKAPHICRWPNCLRNLKPFKANYMLDVHVRCHTG